MKRFGQEDIERIIEKCTDEKGNVDLAVALTLAYTAGRRDQEEEEKEGDSNDA